MIVVDEHGSIEGIVTEGDILKTVVADIEEGEQPHVTERNDGSVLIDGGYPIDELGERLGVPLPPNHSYHTVAGLVLDRMKRLPRIGESFSHRVWRFEVPDIDGTRIDKVPATPHPSRQSDGAADRIGAVDAKKGLRRGEPPQAFPIVFHVPLCRRYMAATGYAEASRSRTRFSRNLDASNHLAASIVSQFELPSAKCSCIVGTPGEPRTRRVSRAIQCQNFLKSACPRSAIFGECLRDTSWNSSVLLSASRSAWLSRLY